MTITAQGATAGSSGHERSVTSLRIHVVATGQVTSGLVRLNSDTRVQLTSFATPSRKRPFAGREESVSFSVARFSSG